MASWLVSTSSNAAPSPASLPGKAEDLFQIDRIWTIHLTFSPKQWEAMEPQQQGGFAFGPPGPGGPGGPGGRPGRPPGGGPGFGPGMFLAPAFVTQADQDNDGKISQAEFRALKDKWFVPWDTSKTGSLDLDQIRSGMNGTLALRGFPGAPGGRAEGPTPGRGRGPGIGFSLQGADGKRNGLASAMGIEFDYVRAELEFEGSRFRDVAVRYKGNGTFAQSRGSLKRSLKIDLNEFVPGQKLAGITKLNLHNCVTDPSWMNEVLSHRAYRDAGLAAPRTAYARVHVTVPGKHDRAYFGLYSVVENVDSAFVKERYGNRKDALLKPVTPNPFTDLGDDWAKYKQTYDPKTSLDAEQERRVIAFCKLVSHAPDDEFAGRLGEFLDLDSFAKYMAVTTWLATLDSLLSVGQNYYVRLDAGSGKFHFLPWDLDHSFGQFPMMGSQEQRERLSIHRPWNQGGNRFLERVFAVPAFKQKYISTLAELSKSVLRPDRLAAQVDQLAVVLRPAIRDESEEKLARFDDVVAGKTPRPGGEPGFGGRGFPGFQPPKPIKGFVVARAESVAAQLAGKETGEVVERAGMGGRGGGGGPPGGRPGGPGGPGGRDFGPGTFLAEPFRDRLDTDRDSKVSAEEFATGLETWFAAWDVDRSGALEESEIRSGLDKDLGPAGGPIVRPLP